MLSIYEYKWFLRKEISSIVISILCLIVPTSFLFFIKSLTRDEAMRRFHALSF